jgi:hypothetical protein
MQRERVTGTEKGQNTADIKTNKNDPKIIATTNSPGSIRRIEALPRMYTQFQNQNPKE